MEKVYRVKEAAKLLQCSESKLNKLRLTGGGPTYVKYGSTVVYRESSLQQFIMQCERKSTSSSAA